MLHQTDHKKLMAWFLASLVLISGAFSNLAGACSDFRDNIQIELIPFADCSEFSSGLTTSGQEKNRVPGHLSLNHYHGISCSFSDIYFDAFPVQNKSVNNTFGLKKQRTGTRNSISFTGELPSINPSSGWPNHPPQAGEIQLSIQSTIVLQI